MTEVNLLYYNIIESDIDRRKHATRALFILTDAEDTSGNNIEDLDSSVIANAEALKGKYRPGHERTGLWGFLIDKGKTDLLYTEIL